MNVSAPRAARIGASSSSAGRISVSMSAVRRKGADDRRPFAHTPAADEAVDDIGVRLGEALRDIRRGGLEDQQRAVDRIGKRGGAEKIGRGAGRGRGEI